MSQETDPSEHPSQGSSEHFRSDSGAPRSHTATQEHDTSSDSDADSHQTSSRSVTPARPYGPETRYGLRGRLTARKSVPLPIRWSFRIPSGDGAGPSRVRGRSGSSSSSSSSSSSMPSSRTRSPPPVAPAARPPPVIRPPPAVRAPVVHLGRMTPGERQEVSRIARNQWIHESLIDHHDHMIDAIIDTAGANSQQMNRVVGLLGYTIDSLHRLYMVVYMVMALVVIMFGWVIWWARY